MRKERLGTVQQASTWGRWRCGERGECRQPASYSRTAATERKENDSGGQYESIVR